jgi:glycosyltransferase involved in cell wall biosynthesis
MRLRRAVALTRAELRDIRRAARISGGRDGLASRARHHLDLDAVDSARIDRLEQGLAAAAGQAAAGTAVESAVASTQDALRQAEERHTAAIDDLSAQYARLRIALNWMQPRAEQDALVSRIPALTTWISRAQVDSSAQVSIVMATRNRSGKLAGAVQSVLRQDYPNWQLVIVDDGSDDDTPATLAALAASDDRITVITTAHQGAGAARNLALAAASGEIVCYLDDDNALEPLWLKALAWAWARQPDLDLLYGARVMEDPSELLPDQGTLPLVHFPIFDRRQLEVANVIDLGVLAHRRNLKEARFDESLASCGDWDLVLRLTETSDPLALPVVAMVYSTSSPNRITRSGRPAADGSQVRARARRRHPLRVLSYNSLFPLVPETYIAEEMKALTDNGAALAWCTDRWAASAVSVAEPTYTDLDRAVSAFDPDVLVLYWSSFADHKLAELSRVGRPFALRVHSFDFDPATIERVRTHPYCAGIWAYPQHAERIAGAHALVPLVTTWSDFPEPAAQRPVVLSASACLPKKDWPTLVGAFSELARKGADCRIVVGITDQFEDEHRNVRQLIQDAGSAVKLSIDVPHDQVVALLARTSAVVYTKVPGGPFGMPRSIIEGMCASTSVVLPDRPEAPLIAGPKCRTYRSADDIVRHVSEALAGGPGVRSEQEFNRTFAYTHFADPSLAVTFTAELSDAVNAWRGA